MEVTLAMRTGTDNRKWWCPSCGYRLSKKTEAFLIWIQKDVVVN